MPNFSPCTLSFVLGASHSQLTTLLFLVVIATRFGACLSIRSSSSKRGWSFINKSTSLEGFLVTFGRLSPLDYALTPLLDGSKCCFSFILLLVPTFRFIVPLEPIASLFAVVAFFLILFRCLLVLVATVLLLV
jgi:hypothetical protein